MRKPTRLLRLSMLLSASALMGAGTAAQAQSLWSDASTWPSGEVPGEGDAVTIGSDMDVVLDVDAPGLRSLTIQGKLSFSDERDISLESEWIYVPGGELQIGTEANPHQHNASITLTDNVPGEDINTMGDRGIMLMRGTLNLHGSTDNTWSKLSATAEKGATSITVLDAAGWAVGDEIVLASTDYDPRQAERRTITAIDGNTISFAEPLEYMHFGEITFGVDQRGEVGMISRNIKIQASEDSNETYFGGHIMAMSGSQMYIDSIELQRMGQHLTLARYPIHWHVIGEGQGQYVRNAAIHDTFNRCVTVHGTNNLQVENNVTYNTVGHCFFIEDGIETGNRYVENVAIQTKCHPTLPCEPSNLTDASRGSRGQQSEHVLLPSDNTVASYWITNPGNHFIGNVAAGSDAVGFWLAFIEHPNGQFEGTEIAANTWPRRSPLGEFRGNTAHSNFDSLMYDRGPNQDNTFSVAGSGHTAYVDPSDPTSDTLVSHIDDYTAYKNRNGAIWGRGQHHLFTNLKLADNAIGFTHAAGGGRAPYSSRVEDSLFVGESDNIGNPTRPEEIAYGRSLPHVTADFPIRGYEYYDYRHDVVNTKFVNYQPNELRGAGALSYLLYTSFGMSTENMIEGATFENAQPVHFPQEQRRWSSDFAGRAAYHSATIKDVDGSVGGIPGAYIVIDNGIASAEDTCVTKAAWGAAVCSGDMGRFSIDNSQEFMEFSVGPAENPVVLERNNKRYEYSTETTVQSGSQIRISTMRENLALHLREMDEGSWVIFELPGFQSAAGGTSVDSMEALRTSDVTASFQGENALWVKLVVEDATADGPVVVGVGQLRAQASVDVSRTGLGG
jgi:cell migration-inducing and hyaluronan-binding protein